MKVFLKINAQGKSDINIKAKKDPNKDVWMLSHILAQIARFGAMNLKIEGEEKTPLLLANSVGKGIGREIKDKLNRKIGYSFFLWPFEQSLSIVLIDPFPAKKPYSTVEIDTDNKDESKMLENFCQGLAMEAKIEILVYAIDSDRFSQKIPGGMMYNTHHQCEGVGKALGRAIRKLTEENIVKSAYKAKGELKRSSIETEIEIKWEFDGRDKSKINIKTERDPNKNIKILKEGLKEFTKAGNFNLSMKASGDDEHHLYEDLSIVLGSLLNKILGERKGIMRTAYSIRPLEGGIIVLALDLGRGYCQIETNIKNLPLRSMVHHFFETFSRFAKIDIVAFGIKSKHPFISYLKPVLTRVLNQSEMSKVKKEGLNDYNLIKNLFRALGESLGEGIKIDPKRSKELPSTKGIID